MLGIRYVGFQEVNPNKLFSIGIAIRDLYFTNQEVAAPHEYQIFFDPRMTFSKTRTFAVVVSGLPTIGTHGSVPEYMREFGRAIVSIVRKILGQTQKVIECRTQDNHCLYAEVMDHNNPPPF